MPLGSFLSWSLLCGNTFRRLRGRRRLRFFAAYVHRCAVILVGGHIASGESQEFVVDVRHVDDKGNGSVSGPLLDEVCGQGKAAWRHQQKRGWQASRGSRMVLKMREIER